MQLARYHQFGIEIRQLEARLDKSANCGCPCLQGVLSTCDFLGALLSLCIDRFDYFCVLESLSTTPLTPGILVITTFVSV